jgi:hypothetical protein
MKFLQKNKDITDLSNFKTKAFANYYFEILEEKDLKNLIEVIKFSKKENLKILFV